MKITSKTGLIASPTKKIIRYTQIKTVQLKAIAKPAPFILKPFAGLYNPYPHGCSLLCNHPTDNEAKKLLKKAKDSWHIEGKNILLAEEIEAIRTTLKQQLSTEEQPPAKNICIPQVESVPEELFRRYTDTDSRPLTPAPTLASGVTRASGSRRCITPGPYPTNEVREKTLLILDLRRSHSQETLSFYGSSSVHEPPLIRIHHVGTRAASVEEIPAERPLTGIKALSAPGIAVSKRPKSASKSENKSEVDHSEKQEDADDNADEDDDEDDDEFIKRRGKKRKKKNRELSAGAPGFEASLDPETQIATIGPDSHNPSARQSLVPEPSAQEDILESVERRKTAQPVKSPYSFEANSYLSKEILRHLRRELNEEIVDNELEINKRIALEEALKTITRGKTKCEDLINTQKDLNIPLVNTDLWITLPRTFSRSSASFELPMDSRLLATMTPLQYVTDMVSISSARKLLYNCIFSKLKLDTDDEIDYKRKISGQNLQECLDLLMGKPMTENQAKYFKDLVEWKENETYDFKTCCGIFAFCERVLAKEFCPKLPDRKTDPCNEIEVADYAVLSRKLHGINISDKLMSVLNKIKTL